MKKRKTLWRWWALALGEKSSKCDKEADRIALIRTFIFLSYMITNCFIIYGVLRTHHFPVNNEKIEVVIDSSILPDYQTPEPRKTSRSSEFE